MTRRKPARLLLAAVGFPVVALLACPAVLAQEKPLDNAEIVRLVKADLGDAVVIAKIKSARQVQFQTSTDDLVALKTAGVSSAVIAAMLDRLGLAPSGPAASPAGAGPRITLETKEGVIDLKPIYGVVKTQAAPFSLVSWVHFNDRAATIRTRDRRPGILVESESDPRGTWFYVKMSQDTLDGEDYRYFDLEGGGGFSIVWSGSPERGSIVKCDAAQVRPGVWRLTPARDLSTGEYGLFSGRREGAGVLFDFGVDR
jgi:hypothetical protein